MVLPKVPQYLFFLTGIVISAVDCQHVTLDPMEWWFCSLVLWGGSGEALGRLWRGTP